MSRQQDDGLLFAGTPMIRNRRIPGAGFVDMGNTIELKIKTETETKERVSKRKDSYGKPLDSVVIPKPTSISYASDTFDRANLALALMGTDSTLTQSEEQVSDEPVAIGKKGQWYPLKNRNIKEVSVKNKSNAPVDATAYEVNADLGMILIKEGASTVNDDEQIKVTYTKVESKGFAIAAGTVSDYDLEIIIDGVNRVTGKKGSLHIPSAVVASDGEIDWFADDFAKAAFSGKLVKLEGQAEYTFTELN